MKSKKFFITLLFLGSLGIGFLFLIFSGQINRIIPEIPPAQITFKSKVYVPAKGIMVPWAIVKKIGVSQEGVDVFDTVWPTKPKWASEEEDTGVLIKGKDGRYQIYTIFPKPQGGVGGLTWEECIKNPKREISPLCPPICIAPDGRSVVGPAESCRDQSQISGKCGMENCHGLEITCGPNIPETCDTMYAAVDICRQYVSCQIIGGKCQKITDPKFSECKSCVEKCSADFKENPIQANLCESACARTALP